MSSRHHSSLGDQQLNNGQFALAKSSYEHSLQCHLSEFGEEQQQSVVATLRTNLSLAYKGLGYYKEATEQLMIALDILKSTKGDWNTDTAMCKSDIAETYEYVGQYQKAEELYKEAAITCRTLSPVSEVTADILNSMGVCYIKMGYYDKAEQQILESLDINCQVFGELHPTTPSLLNNLGTIYKYQEKYGLAELYYSKALNIHDTLHSSQHKTATVMGNLADLLCIQNIDDHKPCVMILDDLASVANNLYGSWNVNTARAYKLKGVCLLRQDKKSDATHFMELAIIIYDRVLGPDNIYTIDCKRYL